MALDGLVTHAVAHELEQCVGGRIFKIHQPSEHDILLHIRSHAGNCKLLLSANPTYPRAHLTERAYTNPQEAPMFCMLLRKHCEGAIIEAIRQVGMERVLHIDVRQRDELGDISIKRIVVEMMGRHSNLILIDPATGNILDGIHHVTPAISSYRIVLPGSVYVTPPEQNKRNPLHVTREQFEEIVEQAGDDKSAEQLLIEQLSGISPLIAKEICYRSGQRNSHGGHSSESLWAAFRSLMQSIQNHQYLPNIVELPDSGKMVFSVTEISHLQGKTAVFSSISQCLEAYYGDKAERDAIKQRALDLTRFLNNEKNKNRKKLEKLKESLQDATDADQYRVMGELLIASMHVVERGSKSVQVVNYYDEEQRPVTIELDPLLSPSENAQKYFKKYAKMKNSHSYIVEQIEAAEREMTYMETLLQQLNSASVRDLEEIRDELVEQGYLRDRQKKSRKKKPSGKPSVTCFTSSEGVPIYVGKNNLQNEYVTQRLAHPNDTWLHTKDIPGSHVVIRGDSFGETTLHEAAQLAAYFSQARESSSVPVDYTLIRYVRKPNGAKPGFVIYDHQKTLFVTPDESRVKGLSFTVK